MNPLCQLRGLAFSDHSRIPEYVDAVIQKTRVPGDSYFDERVAIELIKKIDSRDLMSKMIADTALFDDQFIVKIALDGCGAGVLAVLVDAGVLSKITDVAGLKSAKSIEFALSLGVDINKMDENGDTVLHILIGADFRYEVMDLALISTLLDLGADPTIRNNRGHAPIDCVTGWDDVRWLLMAHGSPPPKDPIPDFQWAAGTHELQLRRAALADALTMYMGMHEPAIVEMAGRYVHLGPEHELHVLRRQLYRM